LHEVFKIVMRVSNEDSASSAAGVLQQFPVIPIDEKIAMYSAKLGQEHGLAMADAGLQTYVCFQFRLNS